MITPQTLQSLSKSPIGMVATRNYKEEYKQNIHTLNRVDHLVCPFFNSQEGSCGIWEDRPSVCRHYFCHPSAEYKYAKLWALIEKRDSIVEMYFSQSVLLQLGYDLKEISHFVEQINFGIDEQPQESISGWNKKMHWEWDDVTLFRMCEEMENKYGFMWWNELKSDKEFQKVQNQLDKIRDSGNAMVVRHLLASDANNRCK